MLEKHIYLITSIIHFASLGAKNYSFASQNTICVHLDSSWDVKRSRRTLNRWLRFLEDNNYIRRIRRHKHNPAGGIAFHTTIIVLRKKAYQSLARFAGLFRRIGWKVPKWVKKQSNVYNSYIPPVAPEDTS